MLTELAFTNHFPSQDCCEVLLARAAPGVLELWTHANVASTAQLDPLRKVDWSAFADGCVLRLIHHAAFKFGALERLAMATDCVCQPLWPFPEGPLQPPQDRWHNIMELRRCYSQFIKSAAGCLSSLLLHAQSFTPYFFFCVSARGRLHIYFPLCACARVCVF